MNPYEVLKISSNASYDEVKKAYSEQHKLCIGDDKAINELNQAYHFIISQRKIDTEQLNFKKVRDLLNNSNFTEADVLLDSLDMEKAEWYYLKGKVCYGKGWLDNAYKNFSQAAKMEPDNTEYAYERKRMYDSRKEYLNSVPDLNNKNKKKFFNKDNCCECCCSMECCDCICDIF